jgi:hypothetical protein
VEGKGVTQQAHALAGDEAASLRALETAESIIGAAEQEDMTQRPRAAFFDSARLMVSAAWPWPASSPGMTPGPSGNSTSNWPLSDAPS